jgi:hypothetical protein
MPGKSKHGKGRRPQYKNKIRPQTVQTTQSVAGAPGTTAPVVVKTATAPRVPGYTPASAAEYPFFTSELKRIAVITVIILVILVVLALIIK